MSIVLGVGTDNGVLLLAPGGPSTHWQLIAQGLYGRKIVTLARHPEGMLYAGAANGNVYRTRDLENWEPLFDGLKYPSVHSLVIDPRNSNLMYAGTAPAALFRSQDQGRNWAAVEAFSRVPSANNWTNSAPPYLPRLATLNLHPVRPEIMVATVQTGGLMISPDAGETWFERHQGLSKDLTGVGMAAQHPARLYATCGIGFFRSENLGSTWMHRMSGLPYMYTRALAVDENDPDAMVPMVSESRHFWIIVAGGDGRHSAWMPAWNVCEGAAEAVEELSTL